MPLTLERATLIGAFAPGAWAGTGAGSPLHPAKANIVNKTSRFIIDTAIVGRGKFRAAHACGMHGARNDIAETIGLETFDGGLRGAVGRCHPATQFGSGRVVGGQHARGAQQRFDGQRACGIGGQPFGFARGLQCFGQQEDIGRAAA